MSLNQGRNVMGATSSHLQKYLVPGEEGTEGTAKERLIFAARNATEHCLKRTPFHQLVELVYDVGAFRHRLDAAVWMQLYLR